MSGRDRETWERFAAAALGGMFAHPTASVHEEAALDSADRLLALTKERWPDELSGNPGQLPGAKTCSPGCDPVTPEAAGDETVTEPDPGQGYRWVRPEEKLRTGDEAMVKVCDGLWGLTTASGCLCTVRYTYRRRIDAAPEPSSETGQLPADELNDVVGVVERLSGPVVFRADAERLIAAARREAAELRSENEYLRKWQTDIAVVVNAALDRLIEGQHDKGGAA